MPTIKNTFGSRLTQTFLPAVNVLRYNRRRA
jgi:hypothetical protein